MKSKSGDDWENEDILKSYNDYSKRIYTITKFISPFTRIVQRYTGSIYDLKISMSSTEQITDSLTALLSKMTEHCSLVRKQKEDNAASVSSTPDLVYEGWKDAQKESTKCGPTHVSTTYCTEKLKDKFKKIPQISRVRINHNSYIKGV